jgi:type I restriction enzyme S subunit
MSAQLKHPREVVGYNDSHRDDSELAEGWTGASVISIAELNPRHSNKLDDSQLVTFVPMPSLRESSPNFDCSQERPLAEVRKGYTHFADGDVLFAKITPCMENGKGGVAIGLKNGLGCGTTELHVIRPLGGIEPHYIYRFLQQQSVRRDAVANFTGSAGQLRVPVSFISELEVPHPPLAEQRRIVSKLEEVLEKVQQSQQRLARIPALLKRFRQSVLAAACSGKLTADWRESRQLSQVFETVLMEDVADYLGGFAYRSPTFTCNGKYQVIRIGNVRPMRLDITSSPVFISNAIAEETERFRLRANDIVVSMTGTKYKRDYGFASLVREEDGSLFLNQRVSRVRCGSKLMPQFLLYWMHSDLFRNHFFAGETGNVNQGNVGADGIRKAQIELPSLTEQQEIVKRVEQLFGFADQIEARFKKAQVQVERLTQSVLAKAFRGKLVPTEAELARLEKRFYEPASELLARIEMTQLAPSGGSKRKIKPVAAKQASND